MIRTILTLLVAGGLLAQTASAAPCPGCDCPPGKECTKAELLVAFPDYCNTPDGMCLLRDNSVIVSMPNFNDATKPPLLMRITRDNKVEPFYRFPTPYPGLPAGLDRVQPMGIGAAPSGDIYIPDLQNAKDAVEKSRLWRLVVKNGKPQKMVLVASGFNIANAVIIHGGYVYMTESALEPDAHPLVSAVFRFKVGEESVTLKSPLKNDPHIIATFKSFKEDWRFGADGIAFDKKGNLFVGLFGEAVMYKMTFDKKGNVASNEVFAKVPHMRSCDGMHMDFRTGKLYMADSVANAIQIINPDGSVETLAQNEDVTDKLTGGMDQPCEALVRGNEIIVSNMDWPFPGFKNTKWQMPATMSVIKLKKK